MVGEVQRALLDSQLEISRKELKSAKQQLAELQSDHASLAGQAAAREAALTGELRRLQARAAEAAAAAADEKASLAAQVSLFSVETCEQASHAP